MIYSVYDYTRRAYDYYEGAGPKGTHAGAPPIRSHVALGATPEQAAWVVPPGAKRVGSGELPRGRIATLASSALGDVIEGSTGKAITIGVIAYLAWRLSR